MAERWQSGEDRHTPVALLALLFAVALPFAANGSDLTAIQDNSFLVEEAYNQERGVVQHISLFMRDQRTHAWIYTFTQEWPVGSQKHQLSYTIPVSGGSEQRGVGDIVINYRYQLAGSGETGTAIAPRLSIVLPTAGGPSGVQLAVPVSRVLGSRLVAHTNFGAAFYRRGQPHDELLAQSLIYAMNARVHLMTEAVWARSGGARDLVVSPGVRWAYNRKSGMQIVPGVAVPVGIGGSAGERSVVVYLSFEHPFR